MKIRGILTFLIFLGFLSNFGSLLVAEATYYRNPYAMEPLVIQHNADLENFSYSYYILNDYLVPVYFDEKTPRRLEGIGKREKFYTSISEYVQSSTVKIEWNYKKENAGRKDDFYPDGKYSIHIIEKNNRTKVENEIIYYVVLDHKAPIIQCKLTKDKIVKNEGEEFSLLASEKMSYDNIYEEIGYDYYNKDETKANSYLIFRDGLEDEPLYKETYSNGEEKPFPSLNFTYKDYVSWGLGEHSITIIAKDAALNSSEKTLRFSILKEVPNFTIFSNDELVYKEDGSVKPYRFVGIGTRSEYWRASIKGEDGRDVFEQECYTKEYCAPFEWDGTSKDTGERVEEGTYIASVSCRDIEGCLVSQSISFVVRKEEIKVQLLSQDGKTSDIDEPLIVGIDDEMDEREIFGDLVGRRRRILVEPIYFVGGDFDLLNEEKYFIANAASLKKAAMAVIKLLKDGQTLIIAGHANYTTYPDDNLMRQEDATLTRLSKNRAEIVKRVFMLYGFEGHRIKIEAMGGSSLLASPNSEERWKNRRVELFVEEEE